eukprot:scaffold5540_cov21-Tisochrysis_lutea.AAC.1
MEVLQTLAHLFSVPSADKVAEAPAAASAASLPPSTAWGCTGEPTVLCIRSPSASYCRGYGVKHGVCHLQPPNRVARP